MVFFRTKNVIYDFAVIRALQIRDMFLKNNRTAHAVANKITAIESIVFFKRFSYAGTLTRCADKQNVLMLFQVRGKRGIHLPKIALHIFGAFDSFAVFLVRTSNMPKSHRRIKSRTVNNAALLDKRFCQSTCRAAAGCRFQRIKLCILCQQGAALRLTIKPHGSVGKPQRIDCISRITTRPLQDTKKQPSAEAPV